VLKDKTAPPERASEDKPTRRPKAKGNGSFWRELPVLIVISLVIAMVLKSFVVQAFYIPSISMVPTLEVGDRVLVCRFCYDLHPINRGDIVVFSDPHPSPSDESVIGAFFHWLGQGIGLAQPANKDFIKRVIGLPGDTVEIRKGITYVNGKKLSEPYVPKSEFDSRSFGPFRVPSGDLFVMGDDRISSGDSRFKPSQGGLGYVPEDKVIGRAFVVIWPPGDAGWLH
jgi:signal peptidase I